MDSSFRAFPDQPIFVARRDVDAAYHRVIPPLQDLLHVIFPFFHRGVRSVAIPLVSTFGNSDSNFQFNILTEVLLACSQTRTSAWVPGPHTYVFSAMATDDLIVMGPELPLRAELLATEHDIRTAVGQGGISVDKDLFGQQVEVIGYMVDTSRRRISISQKGFASLLDIFFSSSLPTVGSVLPTVRLQRMASLAIRYAPFFTVLLPFSRGFSASVSPFCPTSTLSHRAILDWLLWRLVLRQAVLNPAWFELSYATPLLFASPRIESEVELASRQAAAADYELFVDAALRSAGLGIYCPDLCTVFFDLLGWQFFPDARGNLCPVHICLYEFFASVVGAIIYILLSLSPPAAVSPRLTPFHLHVWTDNSSAYWSIRRARASHPVAVVLLQMLAFIQLRFGVVVTIGHIPGVRNVYADAISRSFQVPDADRIHNSLLALPHYRLGPALTPILVRLSMLPSLRPSQILRAGLIALECVIGIVSAMPMTNLQMPLATSQSQY
jgi:hypothetical protein